MRWLFPFLRRGSLRSLIRSILLCSSKSDHATRHISSWRIAVATANQISRPTGICCRSFASKAAMSRSSSFCVGRCLRNVSLTYLPFRRT